MKNNHAPSRPKLSIIHLKNITKTYAIGEAVISVINDLSLDILEGEMVAIVGPSGSGKSTLMNIIGLLDNSYQGEYWLKNQKIAIIDDDELAHLRNQSIGFVFQQFHLLSRLTAIQNVALPMLYRGFSAEDSERLAQDALDHVNMGAYARRRPTQLSGGQQQRVAIARALIGKPDVILADEPTGALDSKTSQEIMDLFYTLHHEGRTIILITHEEQVAAQCARKIVLTDGRILSDSNQ